MPLTVTQTVAPTVEPLLLEEIKRYLRVDGTDEDSVIESCMLAAREDLETWTGRTLLTTTYALRLDAFPVECPILLPKPPAQSVTSITYLDEDNVSQTLSTSVYQADIYSEPARITLKQGQSWPGTYPDTYNVVTITYVAGWTLTTIPERAKQTLKLMTASLYEHREEAGEVRTYAHEAIQRLLWGLRILDVV